MTGMQSFADFFVDAPLDLFLFLSSILSVLWIRIPFSCLPLPSLFLSCLWEVSSENGRRSCEEETRWDIRYRHKSFWHPSIDGSSNRCVILSFAHLLNFSSSIDLSFRSLTHVVSNSYLVMFVIPSPPNTHFCHSLTSLTGRIWRERQEAVLANLLL